MTLAVSTTVSVSRVILSTAAWAVLWPFWALSLVWLTAAEVDWALATACLRVTDAFSIASEVWAAHSAWADAPLATFWMAPETSWVEAFISSEALESSWAEEATLSAVVKIWKTISCITQTILLKEEASFPISSLLSTSASTVKSPLLITSVIDRSLRIGLLSLCEIKKDINTTTTKQANPIKIISIVEL